MVKLEKRVKAPCIRAQLSGWNGSPKFEQELTGKNVLDIGSYNVNGCYRDIFETKDINYTGLDMEEGPNVDIIPQSTYCWKKLMMMNILA